MTFSRDGRTFAAGDANGRVLQWHMATGQLISQFDISPAIPIELRYAPDGRRLVAIAVSAGDPDDDGSHETCQVFVWSGSNDP
jgi:hypothetical protein